MKKTKPQTTEGISLRYRSVWPNDRSVPILDATRDCLLRLLCSPATRGFSEGQLAFEIQEKIEDAHKRQMERFQPILEDEPNIAKRFAWRMVGTIDDEAEQAASKACDERHRERILAACEGELILLSGAEVQLLRECIEASQTPERFRDPSKCLTAEQWRWYYPILAVLMGSRTESQKPAPDIPTSWLDEDK